MCEQVALVIRLGQPKERGKGEVASECDALLFGVERAQVTGWLIALFLVIAR